MLGGALGNLTDRVLRGSGLHGRVVDFIDFHIWPIFNLADSAIVVGAILLAIASMRPGAGSAAGADVGRVRAHVATAGRLDAVLAELTGLPRADVQRAISAGRVTVDGEPARNRSAWPGERRS